MKTKHLILIVVILSSIAIGLLFALLIKKPIEDIIQEQIDAGFVVEHDIDYYIDNGILPNIELETENDYKIYNDILSETDTDIYYGKDYRFKGVNTDYKITSYEDAYIITSVILYQNPFLIYNTKELNNDFSDLNKFIGIKLNNTNVNYTNLVINKAEEDNYVISGNRNEEPFEVSWDFNSNPTEFVDIALETTAYVQALYNEQKEQEEVTE